MATINGDRYDLEYIGEDDKWVVIDELLSHMPGVDIEDSVVAVCADYTDGLYICECLNVINYQRGDAPWE